MILETVRIVAGWLADPVYGVNAVRLTVPKDAGVADFPAVTVLDSTTNGAVARGGVPNLAANQFPCLLVTPADQPVDQTTPGVKPGSYATVTVLVRYATSLIATDEAERHASQTLKCVWRQLPLLVQTTAGEIQRERADVLLYAITNMQAATLYEAADDTIVTGGVLVTCLVRLKSLA